MGEHSNQIDALVVGAGPTGLFMASELTRYGLKCRIIDKSNKASDKSKAIVIQPRSLEIFSQVGMEAPFLEQGIKLKKANPISNGQKLGQISFEHIDSPYPFLLTLEQYKTEAIFTEHLKHQGVNVERSIECISIENGKERVLCQLRHAERNQIEVVEAKWLLGCDGAHSVVRKNFQNTFSGKLFRDIFTLADLHIDWNHPSQELFAFLDALGVMAIFPLPEEKHYRLIFQLRKLRNLKLSLADVKNLPLPSLEEITTLLQKHVAGPVRLYDPRWIAHFHINSRLAANFYQNRAFLVGDAAHIHSPVGAQGMNTGLQDAFNLAWKISLVDKQLSSRKILRSYQKERHTQGKKLLKATEIASTVATLHHPLLVGLRNKIFSFLIKFPKFQKKIGNSIGEISIRYFSNPLIVHSFFHKSRVGYRAPNAPLHQNALATNLYSIWRQKGSFHLLIFRGAQHEEHILKLAQKMARSFPHVIPLLISVKEFKVLEGYKQFLDPQGVAHKIYGLKRGGVCIVRPDQFVSYVSSFLSFYPLHRYFSNVFDL